MCRSPLRTLDDAVVVSVLSSLVMCWLQNQAEKGRLRLCQPQTQSKSHTQKVWEASLSLLHSACTLTTTFSRITVHLLLLMMLYWVVNSTNSVTTMLYSDYYGGPISRASHSGWWSEWGLAVLSWTMTGQHNLFFLSAFQHSCDLEWAAANRRWMTQMQENEGFSLVTPAVLTSPCLP